MRARTRASPAGLIAARAVQGIGGALMTPASLAIIEATLQPGDRTRAIGTWAGFSGVSAAIAPFLGGWLLEAGSWRAIFLINVPVAAVTARVTRRHVPESRDTSASGRADWPGALAGAAALAATTYAILVLPGAGVTSPRFAVAAPLAVRSAPHASYWTAVGPVAVLFGLGLAALLPPLTASAMNSAPDSLAGLASGVNNAMARVAGLLWIAALPPLTGLTGAAYTDPAQFRSSFAQISWICAAAFACAAVLAATLITGPGRPTPARRPALIQTPVPHLACPVAFHHAPGQTRRPDSSQASHPSCAAGTPSPSRPRIDHAQAEA